MVRRDLDYLEAEVTSNLISGGGGTQDVAVSLAPAPAGGARARIHEIVLDSLSTDFNFQVFESATREILDRIVNIEDVNLHAVLTVGGDDGVQYRDRDVLVATDTPAFHLRFINNGVGAAAITVRIRHSPRLAIETSFFPPPATPVVLITILGIRTIVFAGTDTDINIFNMNAFPIFGVDEDTVISDPPTPVAVGVDEDVSIPDPPTPVAVGVDEDSSGHAVATTVQVG